MPKAGPETERAAGMTKLSPKEAHAIRDLNALAKRWPSSLRLFSWSGTLCVMRADMPPCGEATICTVDGIPNDGGDPDSCAETMI